MLYLSELTLIPFISFLDTVLLRIRLGLGKIPSSNSINYDLWMRFGRYDECEWSDISRSQNSELEWLNRGGFWDSGGIECLQMSLISL